MRPRLVAAITATLVLLTATAYVVWDRNWRRAGPADPGMDCAQVVEARGHRPFAAPGIHRVLLVGDSIMVQASCAIADQLATVGITTSRHAVSGSGLLTGMDWVATVGTLVQQEHPDLVLAIFVGNYLGPPARDAQGREIVKDSPEYLAAWEARARAFSQAVHAGGAQMYWISPPPMAFPPFLTARELYVGYSRIRGDHAIDAGPSLADARGGAVGEKRTCGRPVVIRTSDTAHLTDDGARIYGQTIAHDLTADLGLLTTPKPC